MTALNMNAHQTYILAEERKRFRISLAMTIALYALVFFAVWILGGLGRDMEISDYAGPVQISLGTPEAIEASAHSAPPAPEPAAEAVPSASAPAEPASVPSTPPPPAPSAKASVPAAPAKPAQQSSAPVAEGPPPAPTPTVKSTEGAFSGPVRGEEYGNAHETTFEKSEGRVGRSLYVPIWTYMPLPKTVDNRVYDRIEGDTFWTKKERQARFQRIYEYASGSWKLKADVPVDQRQGIWLMLEDGGYDIAHADYKAAQTLYPLVIRFQVGPTQGNKPPILVFAEISQSSGNPEVDASVLYAFRRASFSNDSPKSVTGRFTYRF